MTFKTFFKIYDRINNMKNAQNKETIAYISMEIALENNIKTYSGGLGILAGDILRAAADGQVSMVGITLLSRQGYFRQNIQDNQQIETPEASYDFSKLKLLKKNFFLKIGSTKIRVAIWRYDIFNSDKSFSVPVYLLDTNIKGNPEEFKNLTEQLYGGGSEYRLRQEIVLGRGGVKAMRVLGYGKIKKFHLNEGHGALAAIELFQQTISRKISDKISEVRRRCVFTTHTPVKSAHDVFPLELVRKNQKDFPENLPEMISGNSLNMTKLGFYFSGFVNGVALSHQEFSEKMYPGQPIHAVTNGVHSQTWTSPAFQKLYDLRIPNWRHSSLSLRNAFNIHLEEIWQAHQESKRILINYIQKEKNLVFSENVFTIGFARRFTAYKQPGLLLADLDRLLNIHETAGNIQIVYAGKAHPADIEGKKEIEFVNQAIEKLQGKIKIVFLENYDFDLAKLLVAGVDIWLNTPLPPNEASGTSGMKAAHNGVPQLSTLDGWWNEGYIKNKTGWVIDSKGSETESLYKILEETIIPRYYKNPGKWQDTMRHTIGINASFFNTERTLQQYIQEAYL